MTLVLDNLPPDIERHLRDRAAAEHRPVEELVVEALRDFVTPRPTLAEAVGKVAGTLHADPELDRALADQRRIDPGLWR